jgi:hypothetical protein
MSSNGSTRGPPSYIRNPARQVRSRLAPIIISAVALALMADRALAAEPQMPENFQNTWCLNGDLSNEPTLTAIPCSETQVEVEITATKMNFPAASCVVRQITKFDVCPWGMIFRNRERARALRSFQINPHGPGYQIVLRCMGKLSETISINWVMEKDYIRDVPREYRCPWDRRGAHLR